MGIGSLGLLYLTPYLYLRNSAGELAADDADNIRKEYSWLPFGPLPVRSSAEWSAASFELKHGHPARHLRRN